MAVVLSGSGSVREHVQRLGRILRKKDGKRAILYELVTATPARRSPASEGGSTVLTADLVNARRRGAELHLTKVSDETRARANQLAVPLVAVFRDGIGRSREEVDASLAAVEAEPRDQRLKAGLIKLLEDRATWSISQRSRARVGSARGLHARDRSARVARSR